jgi:alpha/beta superfamily hydrolase
MRSKHVVFEAAGLLLEGRVYAPDADPSAGVVVCHPHPLRGGDSSNNVVLVVCDALVANGIAALAFNFRGVGGSQGVHDDGAGEQDDALAAFGCLRATLPSIQRVGLAGYSFGAGVALNVAPRIPGLTALALVSGGADAEAAALLPTIPKLVIVGEEDGAFTSNRLRRAVDAMPDPKELVSVPHVDHFWGTGSQVLRRTVGSFFTRALA